MTTDVIDVKNVFCRYNCQHACDVIQQHMQYNKGVPPGGLAATCSYGLAVCCANWPEYRLAALLLANTEPG